MDRLSEVKSTVWWSFGVRREFNVKMLELEYDCDDDIYLLTFLELQITGNLIFKVIMNHSLSSQNVMLSHST